METKVILVCCSSICDHGYKVYQWNNTLKFPGKPKIDDPKFYYQSEYYFIASSTAPLSSMSAHSIMNKYRWLYYSNIFFLMKSYHRSNLSLEYGTIIKSKTNPPRSKLVWAQGLRTWHVCLTFKFLGFRQWVSLDQRFE